MTRRRFEETAALPFLLAESHPYDETRYSAALARQAPFLVVEIRVKKCRRFFKNHTPFPLTSLLRCLLQRLRLPTTLAATRRGHHRF